MPRTAEILNELRKSPVRRTAALLDLVKERRDLISLGGGTPSIPPPGEVVEEIRRRLDADPLQVSTYTGTKGIPELRAAIAEDLKAEAGLDLDPEREVAVTSGSTEGIMASLLAVANPGDEVIAADPTYLGYPEAIKLARGKPVFLPVSVERQFQPDVEALKGMITERTKAVILVSPDNPTGRIIDKPTMKAIIDLANDHDFWVIFDEAYAYIVYEGGGYWPASLPGARERLIVCSSFSKVASIPGYRLGYVYAPAEVIDGVEGVKQYLSLCPCTIAQYAMEYFLRSGVKRPYLSRVVLPTYAERRETMGSAIAEWLEEGVTVKPSGAFYYFVNMARYLERVGQSDEEFCMALLREKGVVVIPGTQFGSHGRNHIRLTFVSEDSQRIREGIRRIRQYLEERSAAGPRQAKIGP